MRYKRTGRKAFTLVEIMIALAVVGVLFGLIFAFYRSAIDKSKYVEAVATVDSIGKAEEVNQMNTGEYVAADNTQEVNENLGLNIESKEYNYKVVGVTNDNFIVLAEKILDDINNGALATEPTVIARNKTGPVSPESVGEPESTPPQDNPSPPGGGGPGGGGPGGGSPSSPADNPPLSSGPNPSGGGAAVLYPHQSAVPQNIVDLLNNAPAWGQYADDLIHDNKIKVVYVNMADYGETNRTDAFWWGIRDHTENINGKLVFVTGNTIFVNKALLSEGYPDSAIAAIISHEATHADYDYNPQEWIDTTKLANPLISDPFGTPPRPITDGDIHITHSPGNSIDQEFNAFNNENTVWTQIKGADTNPYDLDYNASILNEVPAAQAEADFKAELRSGNYGKAYTTLPEY